MSDTGQSAALTATPPSRPEARAPAVRVAGAAKRRPDDAGVDHGDPRRRAAGLRALHAGRGGRFADRSRGADRAATGGVRGGRRLRQRDRRHAHHGRHRLADQHSARRARGDLPRHHRSALETDGSVALPGEGPDRPAVDPRRRVRLRGRRAADGHLLGDRRWHRARRADAPHRRADRRGGDEAGADEDARRGLRHGLHPHPGGLEGGAADSFARRPHRRDARGGRCGRRVRAAALHRPVQQLLPLRARRAHRLAVDPDLQLLGDAVRQPDLARLGPPRSCSC